MDKIAMYKEEIYKQAGAPEFLAQPYNKSRIKRVLAALDGGMVDDAAKKLKYYGDEVKNHEEMIGKLRKQLTNYDGAYGELKFVRGKIDQHHKMRDIAQNGHDLWSGELNNVKHYTDKIRTNAAVGTAGAGALTTGTAYAVHKSNKNKKK